MPMYILVTSVTLALWGPKIVPDIVLAFCATLLISALQALMLNRAFPFSEALGPRQGSGQMARSFFLLVIPGATGGLHYALTFWPPTVLLATPVALVGAAWIARAYGRTTWATLEREAG
jgi:hypothetical protein